ncbi:MAG: PKD domain-containing protein [Flavobacteriales bacterium]|nr:PKD domain-containing protein [Flavobacteriales bacterium]
MKGIFKNLIVLLLVIGPLTMWSQANQLQTGEYYVDTDPGDGLGIALSATDGTFDNAWEKINASVAALPAGMHVIGIRLKDANGNWGPDFVRTVSVENTSTTRSIQITAAEFFIDIDPGEGLATPMVVFDGNFNAAFEVVVLSGISVTSGMHTLNMRVQSTDGQWSAVFSRAISVESIQSFRDIAITEGEFFFDSDPGEGNGTPLVAFDGNFSDALEAVVLNGIAVTTGQHSLHIRLMGEDGNWGPVFSRAMVVEDAITGRDVRIATAEFFWDTDPGEGNATTMLAFDGNFDEAFEQALSSSVSVPGIGNHTLSIRVLSEDGSWSPVFSSAVAVESELTVRDIKLIQAEFFWDTDPGEGNGNALLATDGNFDEVFEQALAEAISAPVTGNHLLGLRVKGLDGTWSNTFTTAVVVEAPLTVRDLHLVQAEYFWDTDPGEGNAIPLLASDGNFNAVFEQALANGITTPATGNHKLGIRFKGFDGAWTAVFSSVLAVEDLLTARDVKLTIAEYFWNTDPGQGNGTPMLAVDGNLNEAFEQAMANGVASPGDGTHILSVRVIGLDGTWSPVFSSVVVIESPISVRDIKIMQAEYFFDTDPGEGAGTPLLAVDGNFNNAFEKISTNTNSGLLIPGAHVLNVRVRGLDGSWSSAFQSAVYVDPCLTSPVVEVTPSGTVSICPEDSLELVATPGLVSYQWFSGLNQVGDQQTLWVDSAAFYRVIGFDADGCPGLSPNVQILEYAVPSNSIVAGGPLSFCQGGSVTLTASNGFAGYLWNTGATTQSIVVSASGDYSCVATSSGGCERTSQTLSVNVYATPPAPVITPTSAFVCIADSVQLVSSYASGIVWNTLETTSSIWVGAGNYSVTYTDPSGCSSTGYATVSLSDAITSIGANTYEVWMPASTVNFTSGTSGTILSYLWDFGDGNTSTLANPSYTYTVSGFYTVTLTVEDANGCTTVETLPAQITVWEVFPSDDVSIPEVIDISSTTWLSPLIGYVGLPGGQLYYTTDGGITWLPVTGCAGQDIQGITYVGDANNYCVYTYGNNGFVYEACNGGSFQPISPPGLPPGTNFYGGFWSGGGGYFFGSNNTICYYYNGTWYPLNPSGVPGGTTWYGGWYAGGYLWAYGSGGLICYYNFGTGQWYPANGTGGIGGGTTFSGGYYSGASTCVFVVGNGGVVWGSYDNGNTWQPIYTGYDYDWNDVVVVGSTIICVGEGGTVCVSYDGGATWTLFSIGTNHNCTGISVNGCLAYITTEEGGVYQFPISAPAVPPVIDSPQTQICSNQFAELFVSNPAIGSSFVWSNGQTGTGIFVNIEGTYTVTEYNACDTIGSNSKFVEVTASTTYYRDFDNDGYGNPSNTIEACDGAPAGYITDNTDCNDYNDTMYPGAPGTNENVDNDCNGLVEGDELACIGDLNNDEFVNTTDLLILMGLFATNCGSPYCYGDFTGDGVVNVSDLLLFMGYFGQPCP